jgi:hypothetical protein
VVVGGCPDTTSPRWPPTTVGPVVECPSYPDGLPSGTELPTLVGPYVAVLNSDHLDKPTDVDLHILDWTVNREITGVGWVDSRRYLGLRDPYLVVVVDGFPRADDVRDWCSAHQISASRCYPRNPIDPDDPTAKPIS